MSPLLAYEMQTHHPTRLGNRRFRVDPDGGVYAQVNRAEPAEGAWAAAFPTTPRRRIDDADARVTEVLERGGFFDLAPEHTDPRRKDGFREVLRYAGTRGERAVTVDRADVPAFHALIRDLLWWLDIVDVLAP